MRAPFFADLIIIVSVHTERCSSGGLGLARQDRKQEGLDLADSSLLSNVANGCGGKQRIRVRVWFVT